MDIFKWFRKPKDKPSPYTMIIDLDGNEADLMPMAKKVISLAPKPPGMDAENLARLAHMSSRGKYIKVDEYPDDDDREYTTVLIMRVIHWTGHPYRLEQIRDPDIRKRRPFIELSADQDCCVQAGKLRNKWLNPDELDLLPLPGCWHEHCFCSYQTLSEDDVERREAKNSPL